MISIRLLLLLTMLFSLPLASAFSTMEALDYGKQYIEHNAHVGHRAVHVTNFTVIPKEVWENGFEFNLYYTVSADVFGVERSQHVMVVLNKTSNQVEKIYRLQMPSTEHLL